MTKPRKRTAILISGRGSNMQALIRAARDPDYPAETAVVISNRGDAKGLDFARTEGIATEVIDHKSYPTRADFDRALDVALARHHVDLVALAGFMRIMTPEFVETWRDRMINIHPSLLPAYKGLHTHERVLADGGAYHGCTVHFVRHDVDSGPIIAQARVAVLKDDTPDTLAQRVLEAEHRIYPKALALVASGVIRVEGENIFATSPDISVPVVI